MIVKLRRREGQRMVERSMYIFSLDFVKVIAETFASAEAGRLIEKCDTLIFRQVAAGGYQIKGRKRRIIDYKTSPK